MLPQNNSVKRLQYFYELADSDLVCIKEATKYNATPFIQNFFEHILKKNLKNRWLEKTPDNLKYLGLIEKNWQTYKFIHVLRDFRDIYASWKLSNKHNLDFFIDQVKLSYERNLDVIGQNTDRYLEVKYENIIKNRVNEIKRILCFLDEEFEALCTELDADNARIEFEKVFKFSGKKSATLTSTQQEINNSKIGHYKQVLTCEEIRRIEAELQKYFELFEYKVN